jgi:hypothetical protein
MVATVLFIHIIAGALAVIAGYIALFARKGGTLHRRVGLLFVYAMVVMGAGAMIVGLARGKSTWVGGPLVFYLVITSLLAVRRTKMPSPKRDIALMALALVMGVGSLIAAITVLANPQPPLGRAPGFAGMLNAVVLLCCTWGDFRILRNGPLVGTARIARHLWRMCFAMWVATGSFFLGQAKVIPEPLRYWPAIIVLAVLPLPVMFYWMWRIRRRPKGIITRVELTPSVAA